MSKFVKKNDIITIRPEQNLVASMAYSFRSELCSLLQESPDELMIDLAGVNEVDKTGIGIIIAAHNSFKKIGSRLRITNISQKLYNLFVNMHFNRYFTLEMA